MRGRQQAGDLLRRDKALALPVGIIERTAGSIHT